MRSAIPLALPALALLWRLNASLPAANSRNRSEDTALSAAGEMLNRSLPADAALFTEVDTSLALQYLIEIQGLQPDLTVVSSTQAADFVNAGRLLLSSWELLPTLLAEAEFESTLSFNALNADWVTSGSNRFRPLCAHAG